MAQKAHKPHGKAGNPHPVHPPKGTRWGGKAAFKKTKALVDIEAAERTGVMPKFALIGVMRAYLAEHERILAERPARPKGKRLAERPDLLAEWVVQMAAWREAWVAVLEMVRVAASSAAPYFHARLSAIKVQGYGLDEVQKIPIEHLTDEQLSILERRLLAAAGHVEDIEPHSGGEEEAADEDGE